MEFKKQIEWIDNKIATLNDRKKKLLNNKFNSNTLDSLREELLDETNEAIDMLLTIKVDYKKAHKDSISLGWLENPDRMGR